jgi:hypothetical protein
MTVSLDDVYVKSCLQILNATARLLDKAEAHCAETGCAPETLTEARIAPDMWPFAKQIMEIGHHSARAVAGVRAGVFSPEPGPAPSDFASLRQDLTGSIEVMEAVEPGELDAIAARDMRFEMAAMQMDFTVASFLLSFSLPNFYFHASTAYDILRSKGMKIGKRDFIGQIRLKG